MKIFKPSKKPEPIKEMDQLQRKYILTHNYLLGIEKALIDRTVHYSKVVIPESEILNYALGNPIIPGIEAKDYDFVASGLKVEGYIDIDINTKPHNIKITDKGIKAIFSGEFWVHLDRRHIEMQNRELIELQIESHKNQGRVNILLILATGLAAVIPFVVALLFPPKVTVNVPEQKFRQDIRIDSVWLHQQVDDLIHKKVSSQQQAESIKLQLPKAAVQ